MEATREASPLDVHKPHSFLEIQKSSKVFRAKF